jgi:MFS family permease
MPSLADRPELIGFFSYAREDDADSNGALSALRSRIQRELRGQLGRSVKDFRLWQDKEAIAPGTLWETEIRTAVAQSVFFIPIITPTTVRSEFCRFEFDAFLAREHAFERSDLIFPILYIRVPALEDSALWQADPVLSMIARRQYVDWRVFRHRDVYSTQIGEAIELLCSKIVEALTRPAASEAEIEQRLQREADQQRLREDEKERHARALQAEQMARLAEEKRQAEDMALLAEERRQADQTAREAEEQRQAEEAARLAEEKRQAEEMALLAEERRQADQTAREAEEQRQAEEAARLAEEKRQAEEMALLAEERRQADQTAWEAEENRRAEEAARLAAEKRQADAAERRRQEEERRLRQEQAPVPPMDDEAHLASRTLTKVSARLIPLLAICYLVNSTDRTNVGVAALTMNRDLGMSASGFGIGASLIFSGLFVCVVPSALALERFGARRWIALIMLTSGILAGATAFIDDQAGFYVERILLGAAQAGFLPGMIFYLTLWFPATHRARVFGYFIAGSTLSPVLGAPVSRALLGLDGLAGFRGWQWLFILEAVPAIMLAWAVWRYLVDRPGDTPWLTPEQRDWLVARLRAEDARRDAGRQTGVLRALISSRVLALSLVYFGVLTTNYGIVFSLTQIFRSFGSSSVQTSFVTSLVYLTGTIGMVWFARRSDRRVERKGHLVTALALAAAGIAVTALLDNPVLKSISLSVGAIGVYAALPVFWALATTFLSGAAAAAGIATITLLGGLSGVAVPLATGMITDATGGFTGGPLFIAAIAVATMVAVAMLRHDAALERPPTDARP